METKIDFILFHLMILVGVADPIVSSMTERANDRWINDESCNGYLLIDGRTMAPIDLEPPRPTATMTKPTNCSTEVKQTAKHKC